MQALWVMYERWPYQNNTTLPKFSPLFRSSVVLNLDINLTILLEMHITLLDLLAGLILIIASYFGYTKYLKSQRDIHELALQEQSNISLSRKSDETAIYRNSFVPHEMPLVTGLQIRHGFKLRDGNLRDLWSVVMNQKTSVFTFAGDNSVKKVSVTQLNSVMKQLRAWFDERGIEKVGSCLPNGSFQGFATAMTCFTGGITFQSFNQIPRAQPDVDVLLISNDQLSFAKRLEFKHIIVLSEQPQEEGSQIIVWSTIVNDLKDDPVFDNKYDPSYDRGIPLINSIGPQSHSFSHQNFVSATSALVKTIPIGHELSKEDTLLIDHFNNQVHLWSKVFSVLIFGGSVVFNSSSRPIVDVIKELKPTIVSISPTIAIELLSDAQSNLSLFQLLKLSRAQHLLSDGIFSTQAQLKHFQSVRIIYITTTEPDTTAYLSSSDQTTLRALTGSRIINELVIPQLSAPMTSTNFFDYRIFKNPNLKNRGSASLSLEMKLFKTEGMDIEKKKGELCIRGFIIGKPLGEKDLEIAIESGERVGSEGWMPTGINGVFGRDGCFYEP